MCVVAAGQNLHPPTPTQPPTSRAQPLCLHLLQHAAQLLPPLAERRQAALGQPGAQLPLSFPHNLQQPPRFQQCRLAGSHVAFAGKHCQLPHCTVVSDLGLCQPACSKGVRQMG